MFVPNHWESYCSDTGTNVNCVGILMDQDSSRMDREAAEHRSYLVRRLSFASQQVFQGPIDLETWTTAELEHFFHQLFTELQQRAGIGYLLFGGLAQNPSQEEWRLLQVAMDRLQQRQVAYAHIMSDREGEEEEMQEGTSEARATTPERLQLYDSRLAEQMDRFPVTSQAVSSVDRCCISRTGHFSCPVSSGAVFMGNFRPQPNSPASQALKQASQAATSEPCSMALNSATTRAAVEAAVALGHLPPIVASGGYAGAEWVEFSPDWRGSEDQRQMLRPVIWFKFFTASEAQERRVEGYAVQQPEEQGGTQGSDATQLADDSNAGAAPGQAMLADPLDSDSDSDSPESAWRNLCKSTDGRNYLTAPLAHRRGGNLVMVKLISHEDLRSEWEDDHAQPNIDINYVALHGSVGLHNLRL